jgi:hypothetical protein
MKKRCHICGMIRSQKDLVHMKEGKFLCFYCWNDKNKEMDKKDEENT